MIDEILNKAKQGQKLSDEEFLELLRIDDDENLEKLKSKYTFLKDALTLEWFLYPDTYNVNVGDSAFAYTYNNITAYQMTVKKEVAQVIDSYFDMFGYATKRVKTPYVAHRQNWWYTKTIGANIIGNVPNDYMTKIKEAYDNGLTFWRTPANFLDYSQPNGIV